MVTKTKMCDVLSSDLNYLSGERRRNAKLALDKTLSLTGEVLDIEELAKQIKQSDVHEDTRVDAEKMVRVLFTQLNWDNETTKTYDKFVDMEKNEKLTLVKVKKGKAKII